MIAVPEPHQAAFKGEAPVLRKTLKPTYKDCFCAYRRTRSV
jgi:hypothetical protein